MRTGICVAVGMLLATLLAPGAAVAIVNGSPADFREYPAQGLLLISTTGDPAPETSCGGTLVGSRQFLTAAQCAVDSTGTALPAANFQLRLGILNQSAASPDAYAVSAVSVHPSYSPTTLENDVAVLTLDRVADYPLTRVVTTEETGLWATGVSARVIGWGARFDGDFLSDALLEANVPIISDVSCSTAYPSPPTSPPPSTFFVDSMICAMDVEEPRHDTCHGDGGGPLLVHDGEELVLAGITSWGVGCADGIHPGVYTRIGAGPLNTWVHERIPAASFSVSPKAPRDGMKTRLTSTSTHPEGARYFTEFNWDLDGDGQYDDDFGSKIMPVLAQGQVSIGLEATTPGGDRAVTRRTVTVGPPHRTP